MKKRKAIIFALILVVLTAVLACVHLTTREDVAEGTIEVSYNGDTYTVDISDLEYVQVSGTRVNGKGEEKTVEALGVLLGDVLAGQNVEDYAKVTVISDDSYSAELNEEEVKDDTKAYLTVDEEEEGLRLIVFGDKNSKRSVQNVVQIVVE